MSDTIVVPTASGVTATLSSVTKSKKAKNVIVDRAGYQDNSGNRLMVYLRKRGDSFRVSVTIRAKKQAPVVGCRSTHAIEAEARKAFDANKTQAVKLGWKLAEVSTRTSANPEGFFTLATLPTADVKASALAALKASVASKKAAASKGDGKK